MTLSDVETRECDVLRETLVVLDAPEKWTKHNSARRPDGTPCQAGANDAVQFCMIGAATRACHNLGIDPGKSMVGGLTWDRAMKALTIACSNMGIANWNDHEDRTFDEVPVAINKAIELACTAKEPNAA